MEAPKCPKCGEAMTLFPPDEECDYWLAFCEKCGKMRVNFGYGWVRP